MERRIERCLDCFPTCANSCIMWQALPVPAFGPIDNTVHVATVGLNPAAGEFPDNEGMWKLRTQRLPVVMDFQVRQRLDLEETQLLEASRFRGGYFQEGLAGTRTDHPWFAAFKEVLQGGGLSYGHTAVHIDLVACPSWRRWGRITMEIRQSLLNQCQTHFQHTMLQLPRGATLLLDGTTVVQQVLQLFPGTPQPATPADPQRLITWASREFRFVGWHSSISEARTRAAVMDWVRAHFG